MTKIEKAIKLQKLEQFNPFTERGTQFGENFIIGFVYESVLVCSVAVNTKAQIVTIDLLPMSRTNEMIAGYATVLKLATDFVNRVNSHTE